MMRKLSWVRGAIKATATVTVMVVIRALPIPGLHPCFADRLRAGSVEG